MAEAFADDLGVDVLLEQDRGVGMAEVVKPEGAKKSSALPDGLVGGRCEGGGGCPCALKLLPWTVRLVSALRLLVGTR